MPANYDTQSKLLANTHPIPRIANRETFYIHCTGGIRGARISDFDWILEPLLIEGVPSFSGPVSKPELISTINKLGIKPVAFQQTRFFEGVFSSSWIPITSKQNNHLMDPAELWSTIASNQRKGRLETKLLEKPKIKFDEVSAIFDEGDKIEKLSRSIALSLRSIHINVEKISEYYNEHLVNELSKNRESNSTTISALNQTLPAHVQSFFTHFGAARDYLGALIACQLGLSQGVDAMSRLLNNLTVKHFEEDNLLKVLKNENLILFDPTKNKFQWSGFLKSASELRRRFVHKRPYGDKHRENIEKIEKINVELGLIIFRRDLVSEDGLASDAYDTIADIYLNTMKLFQDLAISSCYDTNILCLTDENVLSIKKIDE